MPAVCRGNSVDSDLAHCSTPNRSGCSNDTFVEGTGISRETDANTSHDTDIVIPCIAHSASIVTGSTTVFINGKGCGRVGDDVGPDCTAVATGSAYVFAGG